MEEDKRAGAAMKGEPEINIPEILKDRPRVQKARRITNNLVRSRGTSRHL
jgi:hypothetical protein